MKEKFPQYRSISVRLTTELKNEIDTLESMKDTGNAPGRLSDGSPFLGLSIMRSKSRTRGDEHHIVVLCDYRCKTYTNASEVNAWFEGLTAAAPCLTAILETAIADGFLGVDLHADMPKRSDAVQSGHEAIMRRHGAIKALMNDTPWVSM